MARKKVETPALINTWEEIDKAFAEIITCEGAIDEINAELNRQVAVAKDTAEEQAKPQQDRIKQLEFAIKDFVIKNREDIDGKTKLLNYGRTGFRSSTSLVVPSGKVADVIAALKRYGMADCITVKESINKDVLKTYPTDDIVKTGAYKKTIDDFWYEVVKQDVKAIE